MIPLDYMLSKMLDDACSNPIMPDGFDWRTYDSRLDQSTGWSTYRIELCCMVYVLTARKRNGVWQVRDWTTEN